MKGAKKSFSGEAAAVSGIDFQYSLFATEIYDCLIDSKTEIEWVEFASSQAGKVDDVLIGLNDVIRAYQVKNVGSSKFSFSNFTVSNTQSIVEGMFIGWKKLVATNPGKSIDVRFITTQAVSENDKIESYKGDKKGTFKDFLTDFWAPVYDGIYDSTSMPTDWNTTFLELLTLTNSSPTEFIAFIRSTRFSFEYSLPILFDTYTEQQRRIDIEEIAKNIFRAVGKFGNVRYTKTEFLEKFYLKNRYESYFRHSFFVDDEHFQPINETIEQLEELIKSKSNGYLALIGNAGSGKSTLLTKWIQQGNYNILKYYAYVNSEMNYESGFRGEASTFLHDLLVQIRQSAHSPQSRLLTDNFADLQKQLTEELNKLSYYAEKTIILVDGLDHIEREQDVERSLISILPLPDSIPENIYFILGSREIKNLNKLNPRIQNALESENRIVHIKPMTKDRVQNLLNSYKINFTEEILEKIYQNTLGHPLFLRYTIEEVKNLSTEDLYKVISQRVFSGDIYKEYQVFWEKNKRQDNFIEILGVISRLRHSAFDISILNSFSEITRESRFSINKLSENYFFKIGTTWQFFHNSFKEFLILETARDILTGEYDSKINKDFHLKICEALKRIDTEYKWNELYHLYKAEQFDTVLTLANQPYFRQQWFEFRNHRLIKEDIQLAIEAAREKKEIYCLFSLMLTNFEITQRYTNFTPSDYFYTFYQLGQAKLANSFVYDNVELLISEKMALDYCVHIYKQGFQELSYAIFLKATPSYILNNSKTVSPDRYHRNSYSQVDEVELICAWAKAACLFSPINKIFAQVESIKVEEGHSMLRRRDLYSEVAAEILEVSISTNNENNLKFLEQILLKENNKEELFFFYFKIINELPEDIPFHYHSITQLTQWGASDNNPINRRLILLCLFKQKDIDKAKAIFPKIITPAKIPKQEVSLTDNSLLHYIFDYSTFYYIISKQFSDSASQFLPIEEKFTIRAFHNAFAELGKSYAYIYHNYKDAAVGYYFHFENFLKLFHFSHTDYGYEYSISENKSVLINLVLKTSSKLSQDIFNEVLKRLENEWDTQEIYWGASQIQSIIDYVIDLGLNRKWCIRQLEKIDKGIFKRGYVSERIDRAIKQIALWCKIDEKEKGSLLLQRIMKISLSVRGEKDYQLDYIVDFLNHLSGDTSKEIGYYLNRVNSLLEKVNSRTHTPSTELLALALKYGNGFEVFKYLLFEGLISFNDAVEITLTYLLSKLPEQRNLITKLFTRIVMAFDNSHSARWRFFEKLLSQPIPLNVLELKEIVTEITICAIQEYRSDYLIQIQEYSNSKGINPVTIGLPDVIMKKEKHPTNKKDLLEFVDGTNMDAEEISLKLENINDLAQLQASAISYSRFDWRNEYLRIFSKTRDQEILTFVENGKHESKELSTIASALIEINRIEIAKVVLYRAVKLGQKSGWVTYYDGGSKIVPFELLATIEDKDTFHKIAFEDYSSSVTSFGIEATEFQIKETPKIWRYFTNDINLDKLHEELKSYRTELLADESEDPSAPSVIGEHDDTTFLIDLLVFLITLPNDFDYSIYKILAEKSFLNDAIIKKILEKLYESEFNSKYIKLLAVLNSSGNYTVNEHTDNLIKLLNNKRYDISRIASRLLESLGINSKDYISLQTKNLPFTYTIKFDYKPSLLNSSESEFTNITKKGFLKDTEDPLVYVRLYLAEVKMLSQETGLDIINIAQRVIQIGKEAEFPFWCNSISEEEIRKIYSGRFDLEVSYKRPRNQFVWDGLMKVIKELVELKLVDTELADDLSDEFDENALLINAYAKPSFISSILEDKSLSAPSARKEWVTEMTDEYLERALVLQNPDNTYILAEHSVIKGMGWGYNEEVRQSFIDLNPEINFGNDRALIFNYTSKNKIEDYNNLWNSGIILYNGMLTISKKRNWLAVNPVMCKDMGLTLNEKEGYFRWDDNEGNKIFESIYWKLHSVNNYSRNHNSEAGYGWYVVMYEKGYKLLQDIIGDKDLYRHKKTSRHMEYHQERYNTDIKGSHSITKSDKLIL